MGESSILCNPPEGGGLHLDLWAAMRAQAARITGAPVGRAPVRASACRRPGADGSTAAHRGAGFGTPREHALGVARQVWAGVAAIRTTTCATRKFAAATSGSGSTRNCDRYERPRGMTIGRGGPLLVEVSQPLGSRGCRASKAGAVGPVRRLRGRRHCEGPRVVGRVPSNSQPSGSVP
jgi:hypothetical protein